MSKVETTSKVSLELTSRMNLGRRGAPQVLDLRHSPQAPSVLKGLSSSEKGPIVPTGTIINPFKTDKTAQNGNLEQCLKWKPQAKYH